MKDSFRSFISTNKELLAHSPQARSWIMIFAIRNTILGLFVTVGIALTPIIKGLYFSPAQFGIAAMAATGAGLLAAFVVKLIPRNHMKRALYVIVLISMISMLLFLLEENFVCFIAGLLLVGIYDRINLIESRKMRDEFRLPVAIIKVGYTFIEKSISLLTAALCVAAIKAGLTIELMLVQIIVTHVLWLIEIEYLKVNFD